LVYGIRKLQRMRVLRSAVIDVAIVNDRYVIHCSQCVTVQVLPACRDRVGLVRV